MRRRLIRDSRDTRARRLNPLAIFTDPLSMEDYLEGRYIVEPLRRPDLTMISDGGACFVITAADPAGDMAKDPRSKRSTSLLSGFGDSLGFEMMLLVWL